MILIPNYPYIVGTGYTIMHIMLYLQFSNENRSQEFSATLPIRRRDIVSSTTAVFVICQIINVAISAVCAYPSRLINPNGSNFVGLEANLTFIGAALACLGIFNVVVIPRYFKTGYKYGVTLILGLVSFVAFYLICEVPIQVIPVLAKSLDGYDTSYLWARLTVLLAGIIIYCVTTFLANRIAIKKFERVNL